MWKQKLVMYVDDLQENDDIFGLSVINLKTVLSTFQPS